MRGSWRCSKELKRVQSKTMGELLRVLVNRDKAASRAADTQDIRTAEEMGDLFDGFSTSDSASLLLDEASST